jgi:hypothetical protein
MAFIPSSKESKWAEFQEIFGKANILKDPRDVGGEDRMGEPRKLILNVLQDFASGFLLQDRIGLRECAGRDDKPVFSFKDVELGGRRCAVCSIAKVADLFVVMGKF